MIVCQCKVISDRQIMDTAIALVEEDPWRPITPGLVYKELGKRHECCGCVPVVVDMIVQAVEDHRVKLEQQQIETDWDSRALNNLRLLQQRRTVLKTAQRKKARKHYERRSEGYRAAE
jgi:bacterioferritin-associated ferredoxin